MNSVRLLAGLAPALLLGGCLSFGPDVPDQLLTLTPTATAPANSGARGSDASALVPEAEAFESADALLLSLDSVRSPSGLQGVLRRKDVGSGGWCIF